MKQISSNNDIGGVEGHLQLLVDPSMESFIRTQLSTDPVKKEGVEYAAAEQVGGFQQYSEDSYMSYRNGTTAIVMVQGTIVPRGRPWHTMFGRTPLNVLQEELTTLDYDKSVENIIVVFDSHGGVAKGLIEQHKFFKNMKTKIHAHVASAANSAAYFILCGIDNISSDELATVGSIGTKFTWVDDTSAMDQAGYKEITVVSEQSPNKLVLLPENRRYLQEMANDLTTIFVKYVADGRNVSTDVVLEHFGQGSAFLAAKALSVGMIDKIETLSEMIVRIAGTPMGNTDGNRTTSVEVTTEKESTMNTVEEFKAQNPDLFEKVVESAKQEMGSDGEKALSEGVEQNTKRITSIMGVMATLGEMSPAASIAAMAVRDKAIVDPKATLESTTANMAVAALTAGSKAAEHVDSHGNEIARQAAEQGNVSMSQGEDTGNKGLMSTVDSLEKMGINFGKGAK